MYIDPFWCGVMATVIAELVMFILFVVVSVVKYNRAKEIITNQLTNECNDAVKHENGKGGKADD